MTIFDSIKYPISNPPTIEELQSVPAPVIKKWRDMYGWGSGTNLHMIVLILEINLVSEKGVTKIVNTLRELILLYDIDSDNNTSDINSKE